MSPPLRFCGLFLALFCYALRSPLEWITRLANDIKIMAYYSHLYDKMGNVIDLLYQK